MRLLVLTCLVVASSAHAQSASVQADLLFKQGRDLMAAGKLAEACAAFEASNQLEPAVSTLLNLGACREKNGQIATAYGAYANAERLARQATDADGRALDSVAAEHVARVEPLVSKLTIVVPDRDRVAGLEIRRNGELVEPATWGEPLALDGARYELTARAPGRVEWKLSVTLARERDQRVVTLPLLASIGDVAPPPPPPPAEHEPSKALPIGFGVGAAASLGGAVVFELWGESTYHSSQHEPDPNKQDALWRSANHERYAAEAFAGAAVACGAVAVWLYLRAGSTAPVASAQNGGMSIGITGSY